MKKLKDLVNQIDSEQAFSSIDLKNKYFELPFLALDCLYNFAIEKYADFKNDLYTLESQLDYYIKNLFPNISYMTSKVIIDYLKAVVNCRLQYMECVKSLLSYKYDLEFIEKLKSGDILNGK